MLYTLRDKEYSSFVDFLVMLRDNLTITIDSVETPILDIFKTKILKK